MRAEDKEGKQHKLVISEYCTFYKLGCAFFLAIDLLHYSVASSGYACTVAVR